MNRTVSRFLLFSLLALVVSAPCSAAAVMAVSSTGADEAAAQVHQQARVLVTDPASNLVVEVADGDAFDAVLGLAESAGARVTFANADAGLVSVDPQGDAYAVSACLSEVDGVLSVSTEKKARMSYTPDDPGIIYQWGLETVDAYGAWDISLGEHDVVVAVLDTGIDWNHPDLEDNMWTSIDGYYGYNVVDDNYFPMDDNIHGYDDDGDWIANTYTYHGTHVAGIVGATTDNDAGMAGIAQARLMAIKVMNESGEGTDAMVATGIRWATDHGADIITMSLGVEGTSYSLQSAVTYAHSHGVVMVAAAGNSGTSVVSYPAAYPSVIAVGATDDTDRKATFSNYGTDLDLMAPGVMIYSAQGDSGYQYLSGTSAAAPHVAGVAAIMLSINPGLTTGEVDSALNSTATDIYMTGRDSTSGWGIVNAFRAVESVSSPNVRFVDYPDFLEPNSTFSMSWMVSGGDPGVIETTTMYWGESATEIDTPTAEFSGTTWAVFTIDALESLDHDGTLYFQAFATVDGTDYESEVLELPVHEAPPDNILFQFLQDVQDFIFDEMGLINFLLVVAIFIAIVVIIAAARPKRRRVQVSSAPRQVAPVKTHSSMSQYQAGTGSAYVPPPPPPPPRYESYVDVVGDRVVPPTVKIVEGTKVVWVNRTWAPPPGVAIKSGKLDETGEHPDGVFGSGMLIAPGDYWSVTFHRVGTYDYYVTGIWKKGQVVVEPFTSNPSPAPPPQT